MFEDQTLKCEDCGKEFTFSVGEQEFYAQKGLVNVPKRCPDCRKARRQKTRKKLYDTTCTACGCKTQVPFKPIEGKEVLCSECFRNKKQG